MLDRAADVAGRHHAHHAALPFRRQGRKTPSGVVLRHPSRMRWAGPPPWTLRRSGERLGAIRVSSTLPDATGPAPVPPVLEGADGARPRPRAAGRGLGVSGPVEPVLRTAGTAEHHRADRVRGARPSVRQPAPPHGARRHPQQHPAAAGGGHPRPAAVLRCRRRETPGAAPRYRCPTSAPDGRPPTHHRPRDRGGRVRLRRPAAHDGSGHRRGGRAHRRRARRCRHRQPRRYPGESVACWGWRAA